MYSATQNQAEAEDDTLQPLAGTASTIGMETSENPTNITMRTATDHSVPSAQDINVQFANSVAAHRADAVTTDAHSSDEAMYNREADEAASDGETNTGVDTITDEVDDAEEHDGREAVFAPISIMPWAKSCDTHNGDEKTLGLRKNVYRELKATRYDNDWMTAANAPETALNLFIAKVKMDHLIFKGALRIDDEFYVVAKVKGETRTVEKFARVSPHHLDSHPFQQTSSPNRLTDFLIACGIQQEPRQKASCQTGSPATFRRRGPKR